jgi:hypothetical protein
MLGLTQGFILPFDDVILMGDDRFGVVASTATPGVSGGTGWGGPHGAVASLAKPGATTATGITGIYFGVSASVAKPGVSHGYHVIAAVGHAARRIPQH